jgi:predicted lipoprotein with Yx(FWY)xxD motif
VSRRRARRGAPVVMQVVAGLALAAGLGACFPAAASASSTPSGATPVYEVKAATVHGLGKVLVDGRGFTLYVFAPDKHSGKSTCYEKCAQAWPPLVVPTGVAKALAGPGVRAKLLGSTKRKDGTVQVTYKKWPLYTWVIDSAPGDVTGQDINNLGGKWYVITPAGLVVTKRP